MGAPFLIQGRQEAARQLGLLSVHDGAGGAERARRGARRRWRRGRQLERVGVQLRLRSHVGRDLSGGDRLPPGHGGADARDAAGGGTFQERSCPECWCVPVLGCWVCCLCVGTLVCVGIVKRAVREPFKGRQVDDAAARWCAFLFSLVLFGQFMRAHIKGEGKKPNADNLSPAIAAESSDRRTPSCLAHDLARDQERPNANNGKCSFVHLDTRKNAEAWRR